MNHREPFRDRIQPSLSSVPTLTVNETNKYLSKRFSSKHDAVVDRTANTK